MSLLDRTEYYHIKVDEYDQSIIVGALNDKRNNMLKEGKDTEAIDNLILLVCYSPKGKGKNISSKQL